MICLLDSLIILTIFSPNSSQTKKQTCAPESQDNFPPCNMVTNQILHPPRFCNDLEWLFWTQAYGKGWAKNWIISLAGSVVKIIILTGWRKGWYTWCDNIGYLHTYGINTEWDWNQGCTFYLCSSPYMTLLGFQEGCQEFQQRRPLCCLQVGQNNPPWSREGSPHWISPRFNGSVGPP